MPVNLTPQQGPLGIRHWARGDAPCSNCDCVDFEVCGCICHDNDPRRMSLSKGIFLGLVASLAVSAIIVYSI